MNAQPEPTWAQLIEAADQAVFHRDGEHLKTVEVDVIEKCLEGLTYEQMAEALRYATSTISKDVAPSLQKKLSRASGWRVKRSNLRVALEALYKQQLEGGEAEPTPLHYFPYPEGPVPINSPFYVTRADIETRCSQVVINPGALIRIKASKAMGKTSLVNRILKDAEEHHQKTAYLNFLWWSQELITDLERFLQGILSHREPSAGFREQTRRLLG